MMENEWTKTIADLRKENEDLRAIKEQVADALAMLHAPGFDNDGGPASIADEVRLLLDNLNECEKMRAATSCKGCKHEMQASDMWPCDNCTRCMDDMYEVAKPA